MELSANLKRTEVGFIPSDWDVLALGSCLASPPKYGINAPAVPYVDTLPAYVRITDITDDGRFSPQPLMCVDSPFALRYQLNEGDIVLARTGASVGKSWRYEPSVGPLVFAGFLIKVSPDASQLLPNFVAAYLSTPTYWTWVKANSMRSGQPGINGGEYAKLPIPIPPIEEQRAIAAALSDVDALIAGLEKLIAKKRDLKQAAMQQLLTGQTRLPGFSGEWTHKQLGDVICEISDGGTPSTSDSRNFGGDVPWVVIDDIQQKISITRTTLTEKGLQACAARLWPQGTLIVSTGATIGEVGILQVSAATKQGICGIIFDPLLANSEYMQYWFVNNKKLLLSKAQGSSIKEVRAPTLVTLPLDIPEIDEQAAIAKTLDDMDQDICIHESRLAKIRELKQGMMQELLTGRTRLI